MQSHFLQFVCRGNRHSRGLQGIPDRAMAAIWVHRAQHTPPDSAPGHIRSRDGIDLCPSSTANPFRHRSKAHRLARWFARSSLYKVSRPDIHGRQRLDTGFLAILQCPVPHVLHRHVSVHSSGPMRFGDSEWDIKYLIHRDSDYVSELRAMAFGSLG